MKPSLSRDLKTQNLFPQFFGAPVIFKVLSYGFQGKINVFCNRA